MVEILVLLILEKTEKKRQKKKSLYYTEIFWETLFIGQNLDQSIVQILVSKQGLISTNKKKYLLQGIINSAAQIKDPAWVRLKLWLHDFCQWVEVQRCSLNKLLWKQKDENISNGNGAFYLMEYSIWLFRCRYFTLQCTKILRIPID